jgi:hypothetical protein
VDGPFPLAKNYRFTRFPFGFRRLGECILVDVSEACALRSKSIHTPRIGFS